jgi:chorismate dehydratase
MLFQLLHWEVSQVSSKLVIAAIDFVNPAPLMWDFEHEPRKSELAERYSIVYSTPSECARRLQSGTADIGLVPVASYATAQNQSIVRGCAIASLDYIRSLILVVRRNQGVRAVKSVSLDTASLTTATYTRILFRKYWQTSPVFRLHTANLEEMLAEADAAVLIGDPALLALEDREHREARTGEQLDYIDLAHEWHQWTGTSWISAFWSVRDAAFTPNTVSPGQLVEDFIRSRDHGLIHTEKLVTEWSTRIAIPAETLRTYLTENIYYLLDQDCLDGLNLFYRYAAECGALPSPPKLKFL